MANTAEESVFLAALAENHIEVKRRLRGFLPEERAFIKRACRLIEEVIFLVEEGGKEREHG